MLWDFFDTGVRHKIEGIMRKEVYVNMLKQHLKEHDEKVKTSMWVWFLLNDSKVSAKWPKDNKVTVCHGASQNHVLSPVGNVEVAVKRQKLDSASSVL